MIQTSTAHTEREKLLTLAVIFLVIVETILVTMALVPAQLWTRLFPGSTSAALYGPFPPILAPVIPALLYLIPTAIGFLCRSWQRAILFATLPAWIGLGAFVIAASFKVGAFYLVSPTQVTANASTLVLFAALGAIGWLGRFLFKLQ
jgi:hydrogenase-4 membrane subunit HyfE